jgi:hypothetical protein
MTVDEENTMEYAKLVGWRRWVDYLGRFSEAVMMSRSELQDIRVARLETQLEDLRYQVAGLKNKS